MKEDLLSRDDMVTALRAERDHMIQLVREQGVDKDEAEVKAHGLVPALCLHLQTARLSERMAMDSDDLWAKIDTMNKEQIIAMLETKDDEAERLRTYVDQLTSVVIEKAPALLGDINNAQSKVLLLSLSLHDFSLGSRQWNHH